MESLNKIYAQWLMNYLVFLQMTIQEDEKSPLSDAAKELINAACKYAMTQNEELKELKSLESDTSEILNRITPASESMCFLTRSIWDAITEVNVSLKEHSKRSTLQWAISNAHINSFKYYRRDGDHNSAGLVRTIILECMKGHSHYTFIDGNSLVAYRHADEYTIEIQEGKFRVELCNQIYALTGIKPHIGCIENRFAMYLPQ